MNYYRLKARMQKVSIVLVLIILSVAYGYSQGAIEKQSTLSDKIFFGGGLGLQFGTYTGIEISPLVGYRLIENGHLALKGTYQYYKNNRTNFSADIYGGSIIAMYVIKSRVVLHAEYEGLSIDKSFYYPYYDDGRLWVWSPLLGIGFMQKLGERSAIIISALWNLNDGYYSPYSNPIIRFNFLF